MGGKSFPIQVLGARSSSEPGTSTATSAGTFDVRIYRARIPIVAAAREERLHLTTTSPPMRGTERQSATRMWARLLGGLVALAILAIAYSIAGKLGLRLAVVHANATAVWPPTGLALAALLVCGDIMIPMNFPRSLFFLFIFFLFFFLFIFFLLFLFFFYSISTSD